MRSSCVPLRTSSTTATGLQLCLPQRVPQVSIPLSIATPRSSQTAHQPQVAATLSHAHSGCRALAWRRWGCGGTVHGSGSAPPRGAVHRKPGRTVARSPADRAAAEARSAARAARGPRDGADQLLWFWWHKCLFGFRQSAGNVTLPYDVSQQSRSCAVSMFVAPGGDRY